MSTTGFRGPNDSGNSSANAEFFEDPLRINISEALRRTSAAYMDALREMVASGLRGLTVREPNTRSVYIDARSVALGTYTPEAMACIWLEARVQEAFYQLRLEDPAEVKVYFDALAAACSSLSARGDASGLPGRAPGTYPCA